MVRSSKHSPMSHFRITYYPMGQLIMIKCECCYSEITTDLSYDVKYLHKNALQEDMFCIPCYYVLQSQHLDSFEDIEILYVQEYRRLDSDSTTTSTH